MVHKEMVAQHYLTVPDCGPENEWHSHHFDVEVELAGPTLNENGYLVDIVEIENQLERLADRYEDSTLNELPEFEGLNPSVEHFARVVCSSFAEELDTSRLEEITVRIWEDDTGWASYTLSP